MPIISCSYRTDVKQTPPFYGYDMRITGICQQGLSGSAREGIIRRKEAGIMDNKAIAGALKSHPLITAAGLCVSPVAEEDKESDIDIFVYCSEVPPERERAALVSHMSNDYAPGWEHTRWGICDLAHIGGEEVWLMYVTQRETLEGRLPGKIDNYYYPTGRLATLKHLCVLLDKEGFLAGLKTRLGEYPEALRRTLVRFHMDALLDTEDLGRAAARGDALFYHFALDIALDHFLQALFALNRVYFPSRKRSAAYIGGFEIKPAGCERTLLDIVALGGEPGNLGASFRMMSELIEWTHEQAQTL
jgi:hypothetical protein